ncbi:MAG: hypothetical protein LBG87_00640 [Spirochaetaceae bacterium]|jgi:hypothetical protein|nr:hypothetical protein [Spirochaetaceae bacterium]
MKSKVSVSGLLAVLILALASGCVMVEESGELPAELLGKWYDNEYLFAFEIKEDGEGYIAEKKQYYSVTIAGRHVRFKDRDTGDTKGSFYYAIAGGELTLSTGTSFFNGMEEKSPFMKSGSSPQTNGPPVEFIGNWYRVTPPPAEPNFTITPDGTITISGDPEEYQASILGNTVSVLHGSILRGKFSYYFEHEKMFVTEGSDLCAGLLVLSPFAKK